MKILLVQLGRYGDMILATPAIRAVREKYPPAEIHILAGRHNHTVLGNNPAVSKIIVFEKSPLKYINTILQLRKERYDYYIDPKDHASGESRLFARAARADVKIGFNAPGKSVFDIGIDGQEENRGLHFVQKYMKPLSHIGISIENNNIPRPELFVSKASEDYVSAFLSSLPPGKPLVIINISAGRDYGMWDNHKWLKLIDSLGADKYNIAISYAPAEKTNALELSSKTASVKLFDSRSFDDVISLVARARLVISPDTSIIHIAAAFDIPVVGLYGCLEDNYSKFHPLSTIYKVVRAPQGIDGIRTIEAEEVIPAVREMAMQL